MVLLFLCGFFFFQYVLGISQQRLIKSVVECLKMSSQFRQFCLFLAKREYSGDISVWREVLLLVFFPTLFIPFRFRKLRLFGSSYRVVEKKVRMVNHFDMVVVLTNVDFLRFFGCCSFSFSLRFDGEKGIAAKF